MPFNPVPLRLEAVERLLLFPVPLRLGTYGKGCKSMLVVCLWLALSPVLRKYEPASATVVVCNGNNYLGYITGATLLELLDLSYLA